VTLKKIEELFSHNLITAQDVDALEKVAARYAVAITPAMAELIDADDPSDPIARQFVPDPQELITTPVERADPIGDERHSPVHGIVHRYPDRVLLKLVHVCPVYCRFCFRRAMVGPGGIKALTGLELDTALSYIRSHPDIWEVIITGGDPLIASPRRLRMLIDALSGISHVRIVRFHTRVPVVVPDRITDELIAALKGADLTTFVVLHTNHAREMTEGARLACAKLVDAGIPMLSQSVLLKGINDDVDSLSALMRVLVENRIKPYYLHHGDLAPGTSHFRTTIAQGQELMRELHGRFSGLCQPQYVLDIPGGYGKSPVGPVYLCNGKVEDYQGEKHGYPPVD
jgi:lysine 2,3-aminomutase